MQDIKLIKVLKVLPPTAYKRFAAALQANFFKTDAKAQLLFAFLHKYAPKFEHKKLTGKMPLRRVYKDEPFDNLKFNWVSHKLLQALEQFIAFLKLEENKPTSELYVSNFYV